MASVRQALAGSYVIETEHTEFDDGTEVWVAWYRRMTGCMANGAMEREAVEKLRTFKEPYVRKLAEDGVEIPEPDFSGEKETETITANATSELNGLERVVA